METICKNRFYTITTLIESTKYNKDTLEYFNTFMPDFNLIERRVWQDIKHEILKEQSISKYRSYIQNTYNITQRTASSIIWDMKGRKDSLIELKKTENKQNIIKYKEISNEIEKLKESIKYDKIYAKEINKKKDKSDSDLEFLRKLKHKKSKLWSFNKKKNKLKHKIDNFDENNINLNLCFGTKKIFNQQYNLEANEMKTHSKWYNKFIKSRDKNIYFQGSVSETASNTNFQISYNKQIDSFDFKIRKENNYIDDGGKYTYLKDIKFSYLKDILKLCAENNCRALSYRILKRSRKYYLQVIISLSSSMDTTMIDGAIGIDYNNGFLEVVETDNKGNIVATQHHTLKYHGTGNKAKEELRLTVHKILKYCLSKGKSLIIEDLKFIKTKATVIKKKNKIYNKMIHAFDYSRYKDNCINQGHKLGVDVILINPYNTSKIGKQKYSNQRKLSTHQAAAYVIARRGQGFKDELHAA